MLLQDAPQSLSPLLELLPSGSATVAVVVTVVLFLKFMRDIVASFRETMTEQRKDFSDSVDRLLSSHERMEARIVDRLEHQTRAIARLEKTMETQSHEGP